MRLELQKQENTAIVIVHGRLDTGSAPDFERRMLELIDSGECSIVLDLSDMEYISSAGLRSLLVAAKTAESAGGRLACCRLQDFVRRVFDVSGFTVVIPVHATTADALASP